MFSLHSRRLNAAANSIKIKQKATIIIKTPQNNIMQPSYSVSECMVNKIVYSGCPRSSLVGDGVRYDY